MLMQSTKPLDELENSREFVARHIGVSDADEAHMLSVLGQASRRALIDSIVPRSIARTQACVRAMLRGTMLSIKARRDACPKTLSMCASSASLTPIWRATNSRLFSSSSRGLVDCISIVNLLESEGG